MDTIILRTGAALAIAGLAGLAIALALAIGPWGLAALGLGAVAWALTMVAANADA